MLLTQGQIRSKSNKPFHFIFKFSYTICKEATWKNPFYIIFYHVWKSPKDWNRKNKFFYEIIKKRRKEIKRDGAFFYGKENKFHLPHPCSVNLSVLLTATVVKILIAILSICHIKEYLSKQQEFSLISI